MTTKFFRNLLDEAAAGNGWVHRNPTNHKELIARVFSGKYYGCWILNSRKTSYDSRSTVFIDDIRDFVVKPINKSWKSSLQDKRTRGDLLKVHYLATMRKKHLQAIGIRDAEEELIYSLLDYDYVDLYRSMNVHHQEQVLKDYHKIGSQIGCARRQLWLKRLLTMKQKHAWKKTFPKIHPSILKQIRTHGTTIKTTYWNKFLSPLGQHHNISELETLINHTIYLDTKEGLNWAYANPGHANLITSFYKEKEKCNRYIRNYNHILPEQNFHLDLQALNEITIVPTMSAQRIRNLHDQYVEILYQATQTVASIQEQNRKEESEKYKQILIKFAGPIALYREFESHLVETYHSTLDELETQIDGIRLLRTREDFHQEGKSMHHCVGGYYEKYTIADLGLGQNGSRLMRIAKDRNLYFGSYNLEHLDDLNNIEEIKNYKVVWTFCLHLEQGGHKGTLAIEMVRHDSGEITWRQDQLMGIQNSSVHKSLIEKAQEYVDSKNMNFTVRNGYGG